jgi:3alpha(or 20beta)-hydroxysteroid dehydrogenase
MGKLDGKVVLVTGAARGQGEAEARLFAQEGARVALGDVRDAEGKAVAEALGGSAFYLHHDVRDPESWAQLVAEARRRFGRIDGLVNNAGIILYRPLLEMTLEQYREVLEVNLVGCFLGMQAVAPAMLEAGGGSIVNVSSTAGLKAFARAAGYVSSKFALRGLTRTAALELGPQAIRVNSIHPGGIDTAMGRGPEDIDVDAIYRSIPLGRIGQPIEIARLALFLISDDSSYCTGSEFVADGGMLA